MMRSLFSGVAGLKTHQTKMDVIGNNIANVNTVGYKSSNVTFQELMYQTTQKASGANAATGRGGVNAKQIGLGVSTGAINNTVSTSGASQSTGNPFDIQITGDSFFIVNNAGQNYFTRAGAFYVDGAGNLAMTSTGYQVMGWQANKDTGEIVKDTVSALKIMSPENMTANPEATTETYAAGIIDKNSTQLSSTEGLIYNVSMYDNEGYSYIAKYRMYNTDTDGSALQEGVYRMELYDVLGPDGKSVLGTGVKSGAEIANWGLSVVGGTDNTVYVGYNITDGKYAGYWTGTAPTYTTAPDAATGETTITWSAAPAGDSTQKLVMKFDLAKQAQFTSGVEGKNNGEINLDLTTTTSYDNSKTSTIAGNAGDLDGNYAGRKLGTMSGVAIDTSGIIIATYDNGVQRKLGQIAVASFANPSGLEKVGENLYAQTMNSGVFDGIGQDVSGDGGSMSTGVLEMSNVDLSAEFTEMITTQRGFQANSRIITVSDSMIEELTNLKR